MSIFKKLKEKVTPPRVRLNIELRKPFFILGDNVDGVLQLESQEEFDCTEIRCELECIERVRRIRRIYDATLKREVEQQVWESTILFSTRPRLVGAMYIPEGFIQSLPFKITIPPSAQPSFKSIDRIIVWNLKGVVAVEGRPDATSKTLELQVVHPSQVPQSAVTTVTCKYCGTVYPENEVKCPNCGAPRMV